MKEVEEEILKALKLNTSLEKLERIKKVIFNWSL